MAIRNNFPHDEEEGQFGFHLEDSDLLNKYLDDIINFIYGLYAPVATPRDATLKLSTQELLEKIQSIYPEDFPASMLADRLKLNGYKLYDQGGMEFVWLFRERE